MTLEGLEVGPYTLERPLGHGGMGSVWLGRRTDGRFDGQVAVKLMNPAFLSASGLERFKREGSVLARLTHPGIARLLDAGVAPTGQPYLVLEFIPGEPIDRFAAERALPTGDRIRLVLQVLDALTHAHANLVIHRDIKPSNILVTADGTVKLLDFGIAKLLDGPTGGAQPITVEGHSAFTPDFAAPEQIVGDPVTTATDVYAVGVLLYLMLAGKLPAAGRRVPNFTDRDPARLGLGDLDSVLAKALRAAPGERYQTVAEFADDLRRYLDQQPVKARPSSVWYRAGKFVRRHRAAVAFGAAVAVALAGTTGFALIQMRRARAERNEALRSARREAAMSELQGVLAGDTRGADGKPLDMAGRIRLATDILTRRFRTDPWIVASVMIDLSGRFLESGDPDSQLAMLHRAAAIARDADLPAELALAHCTRSISFWLQDVLDSARADLVVAKEALARVDRIDPDTRATCYEAEGKLLQATGNPDSGIALLQQAVALVESDPSGNRRLGMTNSLAEVLRLSGRTREAVPHFRRILAELEAMGYGDTEAFPNVVGFLSASLADLGEIAELDSTLREFIRARSAGTEGGQVSTVLAFLYGYAKLRLGAVDSAAIWLERALADTTQGAGTIRNYLTAAMAQLRLDQGRLPDARREVARLPARARGQRATAAMLRARLRVFEGDSAAGSELLERELAVLWADGEPRLTLFALPLVTAGEWRLARGDARGADSLALLAREAAAIDSLALTRSGLAGRAELLRARARWLARDTTGAREAAARAMTALEHGYGPTSPWTRAGRAVADSIGA
jgi:serine/threonine-protein kinase